MPKDTKDKSLKYNKPVIKEILGFVRLLNDFRLTKRKLLVRGSDIDENDAEHSYQLAMLAWFVASRYKLGLNIDRLIRIALTHDFPEVYAGDTPVFGAKPGEKESKKERESLALKRLEKEWGRGFPDFIKAMRMYESKDDPEAKFVYALDKLIAPMNILEDGGRNWKRLQVTIEMALEEKRSKVQAHAFTAEIFEKFAKVLYSHKHFFSPK